MLTPPEHITIFSRLRNELPQYLEYHTLEHTLDVYECARQNAASEGIGAQQTRLLLTAVAYHDSGYLFQASGHEQKSCEIAREYLGEHLYSGQEIEIVCSLIMATRVPQQPKNLLEQILCDADLDYLGRNDFHELSEKLYFEMKHNGIVRNHDEWNRFQAKFLESHHYFTATAKATRQSVKNIHLQEILTKI